MSASDTGVHAGVNVKNGRKHSFFMIQDQFLDRFGPLLGPYGIATYAAIARHADKDGKCWPSVKRIMTVTGQSRRQCQTQLGRLASCGLIKIEVRADGKGRGVTNMYTLLPVSDACAPGTLGGAPGAQTGAHVVHGEGAPRARLLREVDVLEGHTEEELRIPAFASASPTQPAWNRFADAVSTDFGGLRILTKDGKKLLAAPWAQVAALFRRHAGDDEDRAIQLWAAFVAEAVAKGRWDYVTKNTVLVQAGKYLARHSGQTAGRPRYEVLPPEVLAARREAAKQRLAEMQRRSGT